MSSLYQKIIDFGQQRDFASIRLLLTNTDTEDLLTMVRQRITNTNFPELWNHFLSSFKVVEDLQGKRLAVFLYVLKQIEQKDLPTSRINAIINRFSLELPNLSSEDLAKLGNFCLESIQIQKTSKMGWKDLLPEILNVLSERDTFTIDELEYTGFEYKKTFIDSLCLTNWAPSIITNLVSIFNEMPLTKEEHQKVINKLTTYFEKLTPQEIPAFVYQLLKLCKHQHGRVIFLRLQTYFNLRAYNNVNRNENSPDFINSIESTCNQDAIEAEGTVLFHIHTAASLGYECVREFLNFIKNTVKSPEFALNLFQLMVLFTISSIRHFEETIFDIIRSCIVRWYNEDKRKKNSAWFKDILLTTKSPETVFQHLVQFCLENRDVVLPSLVNFAFLLLGAGSALGRDIVAEKQWNLGTMILLKVTKKKHITGHTVLKTLGNCIVSRPSNLQYIECLYIMSKNFPLLMLENQSCITELIDSLVQIPGQIANHLLDALMNLTKVSPTLRDHLILLLRKSLYARSCETRQMAVNGFLKLIRHLKISNLATLSQSNMSSGSFTSGHSLYTQISLNISVPNSGTTNFNNESLCLEVLGILKRCFMQQAEVRQRFYEGLFEAVCLNIELGIPGLDVIWFHFYQYYVMDEAQELPLNFKKITLIKEFDCILTEPLGKLIYSIGLITKKVHEREDIRENNTAIKFVNILNSLCDRMKNCELVHFELNDGTDILDNLPESQQKMLILKEAMNVYEALIGYKIYSWGDESVDQGRIIYSLFQGYCRLSNFAKNLGNPKKGDGKKKKGAKTKTTQPTQNDTILKKDEKKSTCKMPDTVLNFDVIIKALHLLHDREVPWTSMIEANFLKSKREFHQHIMQAILHLLNTAKKRKDIDTNVKKTYYDYFKDIAGVLFNRIVNRFNEFVEFDCSTAIQALECFHLILNIISNKFKANLESFLESVVGESDLISNLTILVQLYQNFFAMDEEEASSETDVKKLPLIVINTLETLANIIPPDSNTLSAQLFDWLKNFAYNNTIKSKVVVPFINLLFAVNIRYKITLTLLEQMSISVGDAMGVIMEEEHSSQSFKIINEASFNQIVLSLCQNVKSVLEVVDALVVRLKSEFTLLACPGVENVDARLESLKSKEKGACYHTCLVVSILTHLGNIMVAPGNISDAIFKSIMSLFSSLTSLTKHFISRSSKSNLIFEAAKFDRLVKLAGKQLAPVVYKFINYIEESQNPDSDATQNKKKVDSSTLKSKVLKETRLIPKVVYEIEQFGKYVIQLSKKTNTDLARYVGQGVVRDFRIKELRAVLEEAGELQESNLNDTAISSTTSQNEHMVDVDDVILNSDEESNPPPTKKTKKD